MSKDAALIRAEDRVQALEADVASLRAIVDRLPKTADEVCVLDIRPYDLWYPGNPHTVDLSYSPEVGWTAWVIRLHDDGTPVRSDGKIEYTGPVPIEDCYSTREAAEAAHRA